MPNSGNVKLIINNLPHLSVFLCLQKFKKQTQSFLAGGDEVQGHHFE